ncbi:hypothetical protein [Humidisolicoccus flavus]|uniref:hypothetical protein n=1 Tax=Humidisolicoccus flavus TaxID=3111414 RepID=UPI003248D4E1
MLFVRAGARLWSAIGLVVTGILAWQMLDVPLPDSGFDPAPIVITLAIVGFALAALILFGGHRVVGLAAIVLALFGLTVALGGMFWNEGPFEAWPPAALATNPRAPWLIAALAVTAICALIVMASPKAGERRALRRATD